MLRHGFRYGFRLKRLIQLLLSCLMLCASGAAFAQNAPCGGDFGAWLQAFKTEAAAQGISQQTIQASLAGITYDPAIIARDHAQGVFKQSFEQFSGRMVPPRLTRARNKIIQYGSMLSPDRSPVRRTRQRLSSPSGVSKPISARATATSRPYARWPRWPSIAAGRTNSAASCWPRSKSSIAATCRPRTCTAPGRARSARRNSCRRPI